MKGCIKENHASRFAVILLTVIAVNLGFYCLPDSILGIQIKKIDLLSDIRIPVEKDNFDFGDEDHTMFAQSNGSSIYDEKPVSDSAAQTPVNPDSQGIQTVSDSSDAALTGSSDAALTGTTGIASTGATGAASTGATGTASTGATGNTQVATNDGNRPVSVDYGRFNPDSINTRIEDFSAGHNGLHRFFTSLNNIDNLGRPVRIAFVGDSFIEGDILVADFRAKMQAHFGGRGVGFLPITSVVAQYRPTVKQSADGWRSYSIIKDRSKKYVLSGVLFEPSSGNASFKFQTVDFRPGLEETSTLKIIYSKNDETEVILKKDDETLTFMLPSAETMTQYELSGQFTNGTLQFKNAKGLSALGVALEDNHGISVDNFALRGNSGIVMASLDAESCLQLQEIRPYDLIILQYGLNVASDSVRDYGWYRNQMIPVVTHIQQCFPGADLLILGISDRSRNVAGTYSTMPAVISLLRAQRQIAQSAEVSFWSIFAAMGGQGGMVKYVNSNWASKDYTHLNFNGGREIANVLFDALLDAKSQFDTYGTNVSNEIHTEYETMEEDGTLEEHEMLE